MFNGWAISDDSVALRGGRNAECIVLRFERIIGRSK
jgi:hypothetical protein